MVLSRSFLFDVWQVSGMVYLDENNSDDTVIWSESWLRFWKLSNVSGQKKRLG